VHSRWELNLHGEELLHLLKKLLKIQKRRTSASKRAEVSVKTSLSDHRRRELVDHRYLHLLVHHIPTLIMTADLPPLSGHSALSGHQLELENALHGRFPYIPPARYAPDLLHLEMHMMMGELPCAWCAQPAAEQD
jgi:hypothetical protein